MYYISLVRVRIFIYILLLSIGTCQILRAQQIEAMVLSESDSSAIDGAHIRNMNQQQLAISNEKGIFNLMATVGDTLVLSNINYKSKAVVYTKPSQQIIIYLTPNTIQLDEVVVSNMPKSSSAFKRQIVEMDMQSNKAFVPYGMKPAPPKNKIPINYDPSKVNTVKYAINKPISFIVKKLNKDYKAKVKYYEIMAYQGKKIELDKKFNPALVKQLTSLEGDQLSDFIQFMDVDPSFISRSTEYEIALHIQQKYMLYESLQSADSTSQGLSENG